MTQITKARKLVEDALDRFDAAGESLAGHVRRASRVASLRQDYTNQLWLQMEMTDVQASAIELWRDPAITPITAQLETLLGVEAAHKETVVAHSRYERNRTVIIDGQEEFYGAPIGQFEDHIAAVRSAIAETKAPDNVAPGDTYAVLRSIDSAKAKLAETINTLVPIVERVKSDVHSFLVTTENELELGQARAGIFTRAQRYVNGSLAQYAPKALEQFVAAQDRLDDASPEDLAQAATSCRRMLKSLADALYPATGQSVMGADGVERVMSDDAYRNRLLQYVSETLGKHGQAAVVQSTLDTLGPRLESLDKLASKGVHSEVTAAEAEICVVWTYLLAADLVRIADRSSALLVAKPEPLREEAGPTAGIPRAGHPPVGT